MTYEQYWHGDPLMVRAYYRAWKLREKKADEESWRNGMYVLKALDATLGNIFLKPGSKPEEYPPEPFSFQKESQKREKTEDEIEKEALMAKAWMTSFVQAGRNWGKNKRAKEEKPEQDKTDKA